MEQQQLQQHLLQGDEQFNLKELFKYLRFWPWFVLSDYYCVVWLSFI